MADMKTFDLNSLRKLEFPDTITESFRILEKLSNSSSHHVVATNDTMSKLIEEHIFLEVDRRGNRRSSLTPMKELEILERITTYFSEKNSEHLFLLLFPPINKMADNRLSILSKLVSMAVADLNSNVLNLCAIWMQMSDCHSEQSRAIAATIVNDYVLLSANIPLRKLSSHSPLFCATLLCSLTFDPADPNCGRLMELILDWLQANRELCLAPLRSISPHAKATPWGPQTPIPGLIQWCVMAPLLSNKDSNVVSELHLTVLETLAAQRSSEPLLQQFQHIIAPQQRLIDLVDRMSSCSNRDNEEMMKLACERFAQALQMLLRNGCVKNQTELFAMISRDLPYNRLLQVVINKWK